MLADDQILNTLCARVLKRMGRDRFADTVRKLLKIDYRNLLQDAVAEQKRLSVRLLRSRQGRLQIGYTMIDCIELKGDTVDQDVSDIREQQRVRAERLNAWLAGLPHVDIVSAGSSRPTWADISTTQDDYGQSLVDSGLLNTESEDLRLSYLTEMDKSFQRSDLSEFY